MHTEQSYNPIQSPTNNLVQDLYDIDALFLTNLKNQIKSTKQAKIKWTTYACIEHTIGIASGTWALTHPNNAIIVILGTTGMVIAAKHGFELSKISSVLKQDLKSLRSILKNVIIFLEHASREEINTVAKMVRQEYAEHNK